MAQQEAWWLSGRAPDCCPAVQGSNPASPQPTAECQSSGGLPPGMALGCGLTSARDDRGEIMRNEPLVRQKHEEKKKERGSHLWENRRSLQDFRSSSRPSYKIQDCQLFCEFR